MKGYQLGLLAQINCSDLPENDLYPKTGLVQFWIGRDDLMGLDEEEGSKVIYYPELDRMVTEMDVLEKYKLLMKMIEMNILRSNLQIIH